MRPQPARAEAGPETVQVTDEGLEDSAPELNQEIYGDEKQVTRNRRRQPLQNLAILPIKTAIGSAGGAAVVADVAMAASVDRSVAETAEVIAAQIAVATAEMIELLSRVSRVPLSQLPRPQEFNRTQPSGPPPGYTPMVLPGESISKYRGYTPPPIPEPVREEVQRIRARDERRAGGSSDCDLSRRRADFCREPVGRGTAARGARSHSGCVGRAGRIGVDHNQLESGIPRSRDQRSSIARLAG